MRYVAFVMIIVIASFVLAWSQPITIDVGAKYHNFQQWLPQASIKYGPWALTVYGDVILQPTGKLYVTLWHSIIADTGLLGQGYLGGQLMLTLKDWQLVSYTLGLGLSAQIKLEGFNIVLDVVATPEDLTPSISLMMEL